MARLGHVYYLISNIIIIIGDRRRSSAVGSVDSGGSEVGGVAGGGAGGGAGAKTKYRVLVLGSSRVGKTSIISQFLYDQFSTKYKVQTRNVSTDIYF